MEELTPLLEQLAAQMNTTVEFLWGVMVRQAHVSAIGQSIWMVIFLISIFPVFKYILPKIREWYKMEKASSGDGAFSVLGYGMTLLYLLLVLVSIVMSFEELLTKFLNPEYWALQQILEYVK